MPLCVTARTATAACGYTASTPARLPLWITASGSSLMTSGLRKFYLVSQDLLTQVRDGRFCSKVGQIGPKWDKSGAFSDQISVHLARGRQMH